MIMGVARYGFGSGILAIALAVAHIHLGGLGWSAGTVATEPPSMGGVHRARSREAMLLGRLAGLLNR